MIFIIWSVICIQSLHKLRRGTNVTQQYKVEDKNVSDFVIALHRTDCLFENLYTSLRDQFVSGLLSGNIKKRLFTEIKMLAFMKASYLSKLQILTP